MATRKINSFIQHLMTEAPMTTSGAGSSKTSKGKGERPANRQDADGVGPPSPFPVYDGPPKDRYRDDLDPTDDDYIEPGPGGERPGEELKPIPRYSWPFEAQPDPYQLPPLTVPHWSPRDKNGLPIYPRPQWMDDVEDYWNDRMRPQYGTRPTTVTPGGIPPYKPKRERRPADIEIIIPPEP